MNVNGFRVNLVVGDWSRDGHGQYDSIGIVVTGCSTEQELEAAYRKGCESLGIQSLNQFCDKYEQNAFLGEIYRRALEVATTLGYEDCFDLNTLEEVTYSMTPEEYALAYMSIAMLGNENIRYILPPAEKEIGIGGYGLYYG